MTIRQRSPRPRTGSVRAGLAAALLVTDLGTFVNVGSAIANDGTGIVNRSTFRHNVASSGGAIINRTGATLDVKNTLFVANAADIPFGGGGAIQNFGTLTVTNSEFVGNQAGFGGAIDHFEGSLIVHNSTFFNNSASPTGGGIAGVDLTVRHSEFIKNSAEFGGGLIISGVATIKDSTVTLNIAREPSPLICLAVESV